MAEIDGQENGGRDARLVRPLQQPRIYTSIQLERTHGPCVPTSQSALFFTTVWLVMAHKSYNVSLEGHKNRSPLHTFKRLLPSLERSGEALGGVGGGSSRNQERLLTSPLSSFRRGYTRRIAKAFGRVSGLGACTNPAVLRHFPMREHAVGQSKW